MIKAEINKNYQKLSGIFSDIFKDQLLYNNKHWISIINKDLSAYNVYNGNSYTLLNQVLLYYQCLNKGFPFNRISR